MAEVDVRGDLVHARPPDLAVFFCERRELLHCRTVRLDRRMARHARGGWCDSYHLARVGIRMTPLALQLQVPGVHLVAEGNRLLGGRRGDLPCGLRRSGVPDAEDRGESEERSPAESHRFPARICSARYSDARIDNDRIVSVGFCEPPVTKLLPSTTNRFLTSWLWFHLLSTLVLGLSPIRHVPSSWML